MIPYNIHTTQHKTLYTIGSYIQQKSIMSGFVLFFFEIDVISFYFITIFVTACILYHTTTCVTWVRRPPSFKPFFFLFVGCMQYSSDCYYSIVITSQQGEKRTPLEHRRFPASNKDVNVFSLFLSARSLVIIRKKKGHSSNVRSHIGN